MEESNSNQLSTFWIDDQLYGVDVTRVQEIVRPMPITAVPRAPAFIRGLINLRGQVATAIGLRELFCLDPAAEDEAMNVVCKDDEGLIAIQVDRIGDVVEFESEHFSTTPGTIPQDIARYMRGVYKVSDELLGVLDVNQIMNEITKAT